MGAALTVIGLLLSDFVITLSAGAAAALTVVLGKF